MRGRTAAEAVNRYLTLMQKGVSCVTGAVLTVKGGYYESGRPHQLILGGGKPVPLSGQPTFLFDPLENYALWKDGTLWRVEVVKYIYEVLDEQRRRVFAYHWHPDDVSRVKTPHLHLGSWVAQSWEPLNKAHFPTGSVSLPAVVGLLIDELGVEPLREDWRQVLATSLKETSRGQG